MKLKYTLLSLFFILLLGNSFAREGIFSLHTQLYLKEYNTQKKAKGIADSVVSKKENLFLLVNDEFNRSSLASLNITIESDFDNILTITATPEAIQALSQINGVEYISIGTPVKPRLDIAVSEIKADMVQSGTDLEKPYTGEGVIIGIVDFGLDFTHPAFLSSGGKLRISRCWIQTESGNNPSGFSYGREYVGESQLRQKMTSNTTISHGTHVCGIAAGNGSNSEYKGIAHDAEIVFVETGGTDTEITDAINYIFRYAGSVNKPAVINLSLGNHWGPHDGTSITDNTFTRLTGPGKIIVGSAGNEGDVNLHLSHTYNSHTDTLRTMMEISTLENDEKEGFLNVWGDPNAAIDVALEIYNLENKKVIHSIPFGKTSAYYNVSKTYQLDHQQLEIDLVTQARYSTNKKPVVQLYVKNPVYQKYGVAILLKGKTGETVHIWNVGIGDGSNLSALPGAANTGWQAGNASTSVGEVGGTGKDIITVGSYNTKNEWTDLIHVHHSNNNIIGDISYWSSKGPTADGRVKPDITAPGSLIASSVNSYDQAYQQAGAYGSYLVHKEVYQYNPNKIHYFGIMQGTSMAAPMVTGSVALMLQKNPKLTPNDIKALLKQYAEQDEMTGMIDENGSNIWGHGKLNVWEIMKSKDVEPRPGLDEDIAFYYDPDNSTIAFESKSGRDLIIDKVEIFNVFGREMGVLEHLPYNIINVSRYQTNVIIVKVHANGESVVRKILVL